MKIVNKKKFIARITELIILLVTIIITPKAISYANAWRGYKAFGGEYLVPVLALIAILVIETILEEREVKKHARR